MTTLPEALREGVRASLPEANLIADADLRERVIDAWALALSHSEFATIEEIPASGNPDSPPLERGTQADHIRGVTRLSLGVACREALKAAGPGRAFPVVPEAPRAGADTNPVT